MSCKLYEEDLALAAAGCLEPSRLRQVREHCRLCVACRERLGEYEQLAQAHLNVARELESAGVGGVGLLPVESLGTSHSLAMRVRMWRWVAPIGIAAGLAVCLYLLHHPKSPEDAVTVQNTPLVRPAGPVAQVHSPSLAVYRQALGGAGEGALDAVLARDERHLLPRLSGESLRQLRDGL